MTKFPILSLAPMAGVTDWPFRMLCRGQGCEYTVTEMISAMGYCTAPPSLNVYRYLLSKYPGEDNLSAQIFGCEPEYMARAAEKLSALDLFAAIDINMGCPARKVTGSGAGCALMKDLNLAAGIIRSVRAATRLPLTVKMRLGWDEKSRAAALAHIAQEEGVDSVTVHGRTCSQQYGGRADWEAIGEVKHSVSIPVIGNGDVNSGSDAMKLMCVSGCDGIAVGRGAMGNPWVFAEIRAAIANMPYAPPSNAEIVSTALHHADLMAEWKGEHAALEMRKHFAWYIHGKRGCAQIRARINKAETMEEAKAVMSEFAQLDASESE